MMIDSNITLSIILLINNPDQNLAQDPPTKTVTNLKLHLNIIEQSDQFCKFSPIHFILTD